MQIELFEQGCPVCRESTETKHHCYLDGHEYIQCQKCDLVYQIGKTDLDAILACYTGGFFKKSRRRLLNRFRKIENQYDFKLRMTRARQIFNYAASKTTTSSGNYLDIGCNKGFNLYASLENKWEPYGVELIEEITIPIKNSIPKMKDRIQVGGFGDLSHTYEDNFFDLVTCIDVIEHLPHPLTALKEMHRILKPGAPVILQTADATAENISLKEKWQGLKANEHIILFNQENFKTFCQLAGFEKIEFAPEPFEVCDGNFVAICWK